MNISTIEQLLSNPDVRQKIVDNNEKTYIRSILSNDIIHLNNIPNESIFVSLIKLFINNLNTSYLHLFEFYNIKLENINKLQSIFNKLKNNLFINNEDFTTIQNIFNFDIKLKISGLDDIDEDDHPFNSEYLKYIIQEYIKKYNIDIQSLYSDKKYIAYNYLNLFKNNKELSPYLFEQISNYINMKFKCDIIYNDQIITIL